MWDLLVSVAMWVHPKQRRGALRAEIRDLAKKNYWLEVAAADERKATERAEAKAAELGRQRDALVDATALLMTSAHRFNALELQALLSDLPVTPDGKLDNHGFLTRTIAELPDVEMKRDLR